LNPDDLVVGEFYALKAGDALQRVCVKLLATTDCRKGRVLVAPEHSEDDGAGMEVRFSRIDCTWENYLAKSAVLTETAAFDEVLWYPDVDDEVKLVNTGDIRWTVVEVDLSGGWAVIRSSLMGREQTRTESIDRLRPASSKSAPSTADLNAWTKGGGASSTRYVPDPPPEPAKPAIGSIWPVAVADRLVFSDSAQARYREIEPRCVLGDEQKRMRSEVLRNGRFGKNRGKKGFMCYLVPRRFEFMVDEDPGKAEHGIWVDEIKLIRTPKPKRRRRRTKGKSVRSRPKKPRGQRRSK
jgi:hypothetical protein